MTIREQAYSSREIISKAVCGRGRQFIQVAQPFSPQHRPTTILGAWVINHTFEAHKTGDFVEVIGSYELSLWYAHSGNSKTDVANETFTYVQQIPLQEIDPHLRPASVEVYAAAIQEPNCIEATISAKDEKVVVRVEMELQAEIVAETKLHVLVLPDLSGLRAKARPLFEEVDDDLAALFEDDDQA
jgi:spore coat protein E